MSDCRPLRAFCFALIVGLSCYLFAQDSEEQPPALGDLARKTRAQHTSDQDKPSKAQDLVDEMQREQEESENAPTGFKSYNAGDYRLLVPFPYSLEGRENGGPVLRGSSIGITNTEVMAGTPIPLSSSVTDGELVYVARQLAGQYGQYASCSLTKRGDRKAIRCYWNGTPRLLGREVWGTMEFLLTSNALIPVMCVSPDEFQCLTYNNGGWGVCNKPNATWQEVQQTRAALNTRFSNERTTGQMCDRTIYPSIHPKEDTIVHPASIGQEKSSKTPAGDLPQDNSVAASGQPTESLGDLAKRSRQTQHGLAPAEFEDSDGGGLAPKGFESFSVQFCLNPQRCGESWILIPEKSEVVSSVNGQYIFKSVLSDNPVMLYAGPADVNAPYRSLSSPDYIRIRDIANSNGWSREKPDGVSTQELTVAGLPAMMTRFRYQRDQKTWWIGERVLIDLQGAQFLLGCTAPEDHFADAETVCTTLVNSLRLR